jgi:hypothetical protein
MALIARFDRELWRPNQGFWFMVSDVRTDFAMTMSIGVLVSRPGESHPEPLSERNVTFSRHSAPIRHVRRMWSGASAQTIAAFFYAWMR